MLSHENIVSNVLMLEAGEAGHLKWNGGKCAEGDKLLGFLPFFHIYVLALPYSPILVRVIDQATGPHMLNPSEHILRCPAGSHV
jgi:hypothetical protein